MISEALNIMHIISTENLDFYFPASRLETSGFTQLAKLLKTQCPGPGALKEKWT